MKTLEDFNVKNKKVIVRCDFNVPINEKGEIADDFRIRQTLPTIQYLIKNKAKVILISHFGKPKGREKKYSLKPVAKKLEELLKLKVKFLEDCIGGKVKKEIEKEKLGEVTLLENLRFHEEEKDNDKDFSKKLADLAQIYINDAFGTCHRPHASIVGIAKFLPSGAGFLLKKEIEVLSRILENPFHPLVAIIGGVKIDTKIKVIEKFLEVGDHLLLGGEIANTILAIKGICLGRPLPEEKVVERVKKIELTNLKLHLPIDGRISLINLEEDYFRIGAVGTLRKEEKIFDIGPETVKLYSEIIKSAKMIIWAGPLGFFEEEKFAKGSKAVAKEVVKNHSVFKIAGGGDTDAFLAEYNFRKKFDHISTGGGAMLEFLSGEKLPGVKVLNYGSEES